MSGFGKWASDNRWCWSALGVALLWLSLGLIAHKFSLMMMSGVLASASFLVIVACGQTFAVATGRGNIDLSSAGVVTLAAFFVMRLANGQASGLFAGCGAALALGAVAGLVNGALIAVLRLPAIVATMAVGYILTTGAQLANLNFPSPIVHPLLDDAANSRIHDVPVVLGIAILIVVAAEFVLRRTVFGRLLTLMGQNEQAAAFAGVGVRGLTIAGFMASGALAALTGILLSARMGGAFLDMGTPYLIQSIGAVVVGGTAILGGGTTFIGTFFGSLLLILLVTVMQVSGLPIGGQEVIQGLVLTSVLLVAGRRFRGWRSPPEAKAQTSTSSASGGGAIKRATPGE